jgi:hypothetical protein
MLGQQFGRPSCQRGFDMHTSRFPSVWRVDLLPSQRVSGRRSFEFFIARSAKKSVYLSASTFGQIA